MIPKIIHYCWFGGKPLSKEALKCIDSWKKYAPDFEIKEWNESNYDVNKNKYIKEAYQAKKFAFVSDFARLDILYSEGGIYLDVDVELLKPVDDLLNSHAFFGKQTVFNGKWLVNTGLGCGAEANAPIIKELIDDYSEVIFIKEDGSFDTTSCPTRNTKVFLKYGYKNNNDFQSIKGADIYPSEYFCPMDHMTGVLQITDNTFSVHHFAASWVSPWRKFKKKIKRMFFVLEYEHKQ